MQPPSVRKPPFLDELRALAPDLVVVVAYGKILPPEVLAVPRLGCVNVHGSLLPKYRGAAPIQWAIIRGERETGVTLMQMDAGMDTGAMLLKRAVPIDDEVTAGELHERLALVGAELLKEGIARLARGELPAEKQDDAQATLAPMMTKETGRVDFAAGARAVRDLVRGCDPWPKAHTTLGGEPLWLFRPKLVSGSASPGVVLGADRDGLIVGCGADAVAFAELQRAGKKRLPADAFLSGFPIAPRTQLGS
jgi:methionyl-tRNA formyltransferase